VRSLAHLTGGLTRASLEYGLTGQTILNLADFSMFGLQANNRTLSGGLLELQIGDGHPQFALGQDGVDVSPSAIAKATSGWDTWVESMRIHRYDLLGGWETADDYRGYRSAGTSIRSLYSFGDAEARELYEELLEGKARLRVGFSETSAQTRVVGKTKEVQLASLGERSDLNSRLMAGIVLQHEAHRDGVDSGQRVQQLETREAVAARVAMLKAMEKEYGGIIGSDLLNFVDVVMYQAGEETFNKYVDALWSSEGDHAERDINRRTIGVRRSHVFDLLKYAPGPASTFRLGVRGFGTDVDRDYLLPESDTDSQNEVLQNLANADAVATQWNMVGALLGTASWATNGGSLGKSILGVNPLDSPDVLGATSALMNDVTYIKAALDAIKSSNSRSYVSEDITNAFSQMMKGIMQADSLPEMQWYTRATAIFADNKIFPMAEKAGIPLRVENRWAGNEQAEAQVANQMMRNYMYVGEMVYSGITDPEIIRKMYYEGFANPVPMENGLTLWENMRGFVQRNYGPWEDWEENTSPANLETKLKHLNFYNITNFALTTYNIDLYNNLSPNITDIYNRWVDNDLYYRFNQETWNDYHQYFSYVYTKINVR
jgi:hypothetical protein